jgi:hypothetical protein
MSGAEPEPEFGTQETPPEDDPDLLDEQDAEEAPEPSKKSKARKRRGKTKSDEPKEKRRPFVESQVRQSLAKGDITETMNRWDWESGDYEVAVKRVQPQSHMGRNTYGFIAAFTHAIDERFIQDHFGGGVYDLTVRGPHPKSGASKSFLDGCRVKVAGAPKLSPMDPTAGAIVLDEPSPEMGAMTRQRKAQEAGGWTSGGSNGGGSSGDRSMDRMAFEAVVGESKRNRDEVARLHNRVLEMASKPSASATSPDSSLTREALQMTQAAMDKATEAERSASEKFERIIERVGSQQHGIPPELLQSLSEQHRAEMTAQSTSFTTQLSNERERFDREMGNLRDRYERELEQTRTSMQDRVDRALEDAKREIERVRDDWGRRLEDARKEGERALEHERERADRDRRAEQERADRDRQSAEASHKMAIEHMKALHDGQVAQLTSTHQAQLSQLTSQHETSMKLADTSAQARIASMQAELDRARGDLTDAKSKISEQGDLVQQATKLKTVGEALGGAFGLAPAAAGVAAAPIAEAPAEPEVKGWLGTLMKFADSRLGENMFDFIKVAAAQAAGMGPAIPSLPGQMQMPPGYGPPPGYGGQPSYPQTPPGYTPPQYGGPSSVPVHATPVDDEEYDDEEYDEGEEVVDQEGEPVEEPQGEPEPVVTSQVDGDGVVHGHVPYGRPIGANAEEAPHAARPRPQQPGAAQPPGSQPMTEEEAKKQAVAMIQGVEEAMNDNTPPDQLAGIIAQMAPPDQIVPFATAPLDKLIEQLIALVPDTMLGTFAGRQYLSSLQTSLRAVLNIPAS